MRIVDRMRISVLKRSSVIVLRSDIAKLGGSTQVGEGLRTLIAEGQLIRLGEGIYAKATPGSGRPVAAAGAHDLVMEVLRRMGLNHPKVRTVQEGALWRLTVETSNRTIARHLTIGNISVEIVTQPPVTKAPILPEDPARLPRRGVRQYIERLAQFHHVNASSSALNKWTEAVSRAAGDTVQLDAVGRLLAKLKQEHIISGRQMAHLMNNYATERDRANAHV